MAISWGMPLFERHPDVMTTSLRLKLEIDLESLRPLGFRTSMPRWDCLKTAVYSGLLESEKMTSNPCIFNSYVKLPEGNP